MGNRNNGDKYTITSSFYFVPRRGKKFLREIYQDAHKASLTLINMLC